jgi:SOS-response transcriptional repressor LexA
MLTKRQRELVEFIDKETKARGGVCPSYEEMAAGIGVASKSRIHDLLRKCAERGAVRLGGQFRKRSVEVVKDGHAAEVLPGTLSSGGKPILKYRGTWFRFDRETKELKEMP